MKKAYLNPKQLHFAQSPAKRKTAMGGRASGKSTLIGVNTWLKFNYLARSKNLLAGLSYAHILTKSLPSVEEFMQKMGLREYDWATKRGHYTVGIRPPRHWLNSFSRPRSYDHVISFLNGTCTELFSQDRPDAGRGGNYDSVDIDESALMRRDVVKKVIFPSIRGNIFRFNHWLHHSKADFTSPPWLGSGQWIYETQKAMTDFPDDNLFLQLSAYDNKEVLGQQWFIDMQRELSPLEFKVEIKGEPISRVPNSFYPSFNENTHVRRARWDYDQNPAGRMYVKTMLDYDPTRPLEISFDFNADFTSCSIWQLFHDKGILEERCIKVLYVKEGSLEDGQNKIDALVTKVMEHFKNHQHRMIHIYGDRNGNNRQVNSDKTFYQQISDQFQSADWTPHIHVQGLDPEHRLKHRVINAILSEQSDQLPRVRLILEETTALVLSIKNAPITPDFKKDKRSEKRLSVTDREKATDLSDTFDYYLFHKYAQKFGAGGGSSLAGFI